MFQLVHFCFPAHIWWKVPPPPTTTAHAILIRASAQEDCSDFLVTEALEFPSHASVFSLYVLLLSTVDVLPPVVLSHFSLLYRVCTTQTPSTPFLVIHQFYPSSSLDDLKWSVSCHVLTSLVALFLCYLPFSHSQRKSVCVCVHSHHKLAVSQ